MKLQHPSRHRSRIGLGLVSMAAGVTLGCAGSIPGEPDPDLARPVSLQPDAGAQRTNPEPRAAVDAAAKPDGRAADAVFARSRPPEFGVLVSAKVPPPPLSGGTLRMLADGFTAVAADPDRDAVYVVNVARQVLRLTIPMQPGDEPGRIAEDAAGNVHVVLRRGGAVVSIDPRVGTVLDRRAVCGAPRGIAFDAAQGLLHVACAGGELVSLPPAAGARIVRSVELERDLRDVVVQGGQIFVSRFRSAEALVVGDDGKIRERLRPAGVGSSGMPRAGGPDAGLSPSSAAVAWRMVAAPAGGVLMVHQAGLDGDIGTQPGAYGGGACGGIVESTVAALRPGTPAIRTAALAGLVLPVDIALHPDGRRVALVAAANSRNPGTLQVLTSSLETFTDPGADCVPPSSGVPPPAGGRDAGTADAGTDDGELPDPEEFRQPEGEAVAVVFDRRGNIIVQTREPATLQVITQGLPAIVLSSESRADTGHAIFHANSGANVACASCHPEGGDDGRVWRFAKLGPRRTQSLRGGILATAPFHWSGDMGNLGQLMTEVFVGRMTGPQLQTEQVAALGSWLDSIPLLASGPARDPAAAARGRALFENGQVACASCHAGALLTNNASVDVGTGGLFQVPSLRGVSWRAPFMHTGCAPTLAERFGAGCGGDGRHGGVAGLAEGQLTDLIVFLETL